MVTSNIELKKNQVGAFLKVLAKDTQRPQFTVGMVQKWGENNVLIGTDGYIMAVLYLDQEDSEELIGRKIRRDAFERWYKLATGASRLTTRELVNISSDDFAQHGSYYDGDYPDVKAIYDSLQQEPQDEIILNANYAKVLQDLDGADGLKYEMNGYLKPLKVETERGIYLLAPRKN